MFYCEFTKISKNNFFTEHLYTLLLTFSLPLTFHFQRYPVDTKDVKKVDPGRLLTAFLFLFERINKFNN